MQSYSNISLNASFCLTWQFQVLNPDNTPAKLVELVVQPGPLKVRTGNNGYAKVPINTEENTNKLTVTVRMF